MSDRFKVIIIDDHPLIREGLKAVIGKSRKFCVTGDAETAPEGFELVMKSKPDLVLLDIALHGKSGIELGKQLLKADRDLKIIIITMHSKIQYIIDSLEYGFRGYILKDTSPETLIAGMEKVMDGELYVDSYISNRVISRLVKKPESWGKEMSDSSSYEALTTREQEVLRLLVNGCSLKEVGEQLFISVKTVENHKASIMAKLKCSNMVELVRFAFEIGIVDTSGTAEQLF